MERGSARDASPCGVARLSSPSARLGNAWRRRNILHPQLILEGEEVLAQGIRAEAIVSELPFTPRLDEARTRQLLQVVRHRRLRHRKLFAQMPAPDLSAVGDLRQNLKSTRVSEGFGDSSETFVVERHRAYR